MVVACIMAAQFEDSEFRVCSDRLRASGIELHVVGACEGQELHGRKRQESVRVAKGVDEAHAGDYAALLVPGGGSPGVLRTDERFVELVREFDRAGKPIGAICDGPQILLTADLVRGRRMTACPTQQDELARAGAQLLDHPVVVDGNLLTGQSTDAIDALCIELVAALGLGGGEDAATISVAETS